MTLVSKKIYLSALVLSFLLASAASARAEEKGMFDFFKKGDKPASQTVPVQAAQAALQDAGSG